MTSSRVNTVSRGIPSAGGFQGAEERANSTNATVIICPDPDEGEKAAAIIFTLAGLGITMNLVVMMLILTRKSLRR